MPADPRARLHPQARAVVEDLYRSGAHPRHTLSPIQARAALQRLPVPEGPSVGAVSDITFEGRAGPLKARLYRPIDRSQGTLLYLHGGGWVLGTLDGSDALCRRLARLATCNVVSLDYRLAPEHPFPAALDDTWDCLMSLAAGELIGAGSVGPIAIAGLSAGGNLAAVTSLQARSQGSVRIVHQLLIVPVCDCDLDRPSYIENEVGLGLERDEMRWFWEHYLPNAEARRSWLASPTRADSLADLPPTSVVVADCDPLRDEGEDFARRLHASGVPVVCTRWFGVNHGFFGNDRIDAGAMALRAEAEALSRGFQRDSQVS